MLNAVERMTLRPIFNDLEKDWCALAGRLLVSGTRKLRLRFGFQRFLSSSSPVIFRRRTVNSGNK
jgi:hypothetical protein